MSSVRPGSRLATATPVNAGICKQAPITSESTTRATPHRIKPAAADSLRLTCGCGHGSALARDRKRVVEGKSVSGRVDLGGRGVRKKQNEMKHRSRTGKLTNKSHTTT